LKHVSAFMVICLGGGAGNESVYAEDVPKGSVIIVLSCGVGVVCMIVYALLCSVILGAAAYLYTYVDDELYGGHEIISAHLHTGIERALIDISHERVPHAVTPIV
jgi:hypothetical protein